MLKQADTLWKQTLKSFVVSTSTKPYCVQQRSGKKGKIFVKQLAGDFKMVQASCIGLCALNVAPMLIRCRQGSGGV